MLSIPRKTLNTIRKYLLRQQKEAEEDLSSVEKEDPARLEGLAESSEPGTDSWVSEMHNRTLTLGLELRSHAGNVKKALAKIKNGTYGHCEKCGAHIPASRLLIVPTAKYCIQCSSKKISKS